MEKELNIIAKDVFCVMASSYNAINHVHMPLVADLYVLFLFYLEDGRAQGIYTHGPFLFPSYEISHIRHHI